MTLICYEKKYIKECVTVLERKFLHLLEGISKATALFLPVCFRFILYHEDNVKLLLVHIVDDERMPRGK